MKRPEELVQALTAAVPKGIRSIVLYGSAAAGDHQERRSDYNVMVILDELDLGALQAMAPVSRQWQRAGNPAPLLFTLDRLRRSSDVFPIEIRDLQDRHRVLFGEELLLDIEIDLANLRRELEHELEANLVRLRQGYLLVADKPAKVWDLIEDSLSTFLVLIRAALRLYGGPVPADKLQSPPLLAARMTYDHEVFLELEGLRRRGEKPPKAEIAARFARYLAAVEQLLNAVDAFEVGRSRGAAPAAPAGGEDPRPATG
ncbi:MAG: nucleotidyltransferase domain-containing protein [Gemmatimonadota bacterium]